MLDQDITRRMDAYRGNPQALAQRYQQSQQLIDLLALQKLKSEKEAAARSLQMQQAPAGGLPTVAQQREKEVMDMTRQEVAQNVGQAAQQQQQQQQENMKRLMSGIARAPGAETAMPPQAMAAGGIVAFQSGGSSKTYKGKRWEDLQSESDVSPPPEYPAYHTSLKRAFTRGGRKINPDTGEPISFGEFLRLAEKEAMEQGAAAEPSARIPAGGIPGSDVATAESRPMPPDQEGGAVGLPAIFQRKPTEAAAPPPSSETAESAPAPAPAPGEVGPPVVSREKDTARPTGGIDALLNQAITAGRNAVPSGEGIAAAAPTAGKSVADIIAQARGLAGADTAQTEADRTAANALEEQRNAIASIKEQASKRPMMSAEDLAARRADIASAKQRMQQEFEPGKQNLDQLIALLAAMGGRTSIGSMGAAGAMAGQRVAGQQEAARRERLKEISGMEESLRQRQEADRLGKFTSEMEAAKTGLGAYGDVAKLANDVAQGKARIANELTTNAMRIAGQAGITDAQIAAEAKNLAARLNFQGRENEIKNLIDVAKVEVDRERLQVERDRAARLSDPQAMIDNYTQEYIAQGFKPTKAKDMATEKYQRMFRDVESRERATTAKTYADILRSPEYLMLLPKLQSKDPAVRADAEQQRQALFRNASLNPNAAEASPTGAGAGAPLPKTEAELKAGQLYNTAKGLARWDGKQFILEGQ